MSDASSDLLEREAPLRLLGDALDDAADGRGSVAVVSGEPGIGKSALVACFGARCGAARVLVGICDDLAVPRPLGPFRDLVADLPGSSLAGAVDATSPWEFASVLLDDVRSSRAPTVMVIEDAHWVDQATADVITLLGRRLSELPLLLVLTLRPGELDGDHPLRPTIEALHRSRLLHVELAPLSHDAVRQLAGDADVDHIHALSGGNPFFVTELLEHGPTTQPPSLSNVVLGRVARLPPHTRELLDLVSVVPRRVPTSVLDRVEPGWPEAAEPAERARLLTGDSRHLRFRHDLTRSIIHDALPRGRRRRLHARVLDALRTLEADPADLVHHAEAAGEVAVVAELAAVAGRQAEAAGANREAFAQFRRALDFADQLEDSEQAALLEAVARTACLVGRFDDALRAATDAIARYEAAGDRSGAGRCCSVRAHLHWFLGEGQSAWEDACAGVRSLEAAGSSLDLARAYARSSELSMLAGRASDALEWGRRALQLADGDHEVRAAALATIGAMRLQLDADDVQPLLAALQVAAETGRHEQVVLVMTAFAWVNLQWVRPERALAHAEQGLRYARAHEVDSLAPYLDAVLAWIEVRAGRWEHADHLMAVEQADGTAGPRAVARLQARTVLAERAIRCGHDDAEQRLRRVIEDAGRTGELKRIGPALELELEFALTRGRPLPCERLTEVADTVGPDALHAGQGAARLAAWAAVCGVPMTFSGKASAPHAAMIARDWRRAAEEFGAVGWHHDRALVLSLLDDEEALVDALAYARSSGAAPLARHVATRMRDLGLAVPRGPRRSTRSNPGQLTDRQLEILRQVRQGRRNGEIADALHISPRTVEHHVTAILRRLGVSSRAEAVARASDLELA